MRTLTIKFTFSSISHFKPSFNYTIFTPFEPSQQSRTAARSRDRQVASFLSLFLKFYYSFVAWVWMSALRAGRRCAEGELVSITCRHAGNKKHNKSGGGDLVKNSERKSNSRWVFQLNFPLITKASAEFSLRDCSFQSTSTPTWISLAFPHFASIRI